MGRNRAKFNITFNTVRWMMAEASEPS